MLRHVPLYYLLARLLAANQGNQIVGTHVTHSDFGICWSILIWSVIWSMRPGDHRSNINNSVIRSYSIRVKRLLVWSEVDKVDRWEVYFIFLVHVLSPSRRWSSRPHLVVVWTFRTLRGTWSRRRFLIRSIIGLFLIFFYFFSIFFFGLELHQAEGPLDMLCTSVDQRVRASFPVGHVVRSTNHTAES